MSTLKASLRAGSILCLMLACIAAGGASTALHIGGAVSTPSDWSVDQLQTQFAADIKPIDYNSRGAKHTFSCIPLVTLLKAAGVDADFKMQGGADPKNKNPQMRVAILAHGRDGYAVVFSLPELLPMVGNHAVWAAIAVDGKALSDSDGPVRLIVPQDGMPARGVHQLDSIEVINLGAPATQPSSG